MVKTQQKLKIPELMKICPKNKLMKECKRRHWNRGKGRVERKGMRGRG
jgi:ribosomal protein L39E